MLRGVIPLGYRSILNLECIANVLFKKRSKIEQEKEGGGEREETGKSGTSHTRYRRSGENGTARR